MFYIHCILMPGRGRACGPREGRGHEQHLRAALKHERLVNLGESQVVARLRYTDTDMNSTRKFKQISNC